eukprot:CAMPEP_0198276022 /NCGR_PEP_ID=MMETSP1447-20131203/65089_1 /TAXON_ID=420782 /ORGANISM="Chaetoceros dichaeta, Strain CCMP1751" /LENGTH=676 /DNA_ID=CAMNT_0043970939 /DNA_START=156 /DNA_END=2187 /DNA_ORIENTATION=-
MFIINVLAILVFVDTGDAATCNINDGLRITHQTAFISPIFKTRRSRLYTKKPDPPSIKPPPLDDDILNGDDVETPPLFDVSSSVDQEAVKEFGVNLSKNLSKTYVAPVFSREVVRGVPLEIFKGALVSGIALSVLAGKGVLLGGATGLGVAYVATTPGPTGDSARIVGKVTWSSTQILLHLNKKYEVGKKVGMFLKSVLPAARAIGKSERLKALTERLLDEVNDRMEEELAPPPTVEVDDEVMRLVKEADRLEEDLVPPPAVEVDDEITRLVKEAEDTVANVQNILDGDIEEEMDATSEAAAKLQKAQNDERKQRSLLEFRLEIENTEKSRKVDISIDAESDIEEEIDATSEAAAKAKIPAESRLEIETTEKSRKAQIEAERKQRSLLESRLEIETTEKSRKVQIEAERKQRSLLESRLEIETTEKGRKATIEAERKQRSLLETRLTIETAERNAKAAAELRKAQIEAKSEVADELNITPALSENLIDEPDVTSSEPEVSMEVQYIGEDEWEDSIRLAESLDSESDVADELYATPDLAENTIDEPDVTSKKPKVEMEEISISFEAENDIEEELDAARELANSLIDESDNILSETEMSMEELGKAARAAVDQYEKEQQEKEIDTVKKEETKSSDRTLEASQDYESLTVVKLKDILRSRGLKVSGKKADLIIRLRENE